MNGNWNSTEKFNTEASMWDSDPRRRGLAGAVAEAIIARCSPVKTMQALEAGCGTGLVSMAIAPLVKQLTAIDTSQEMLHVLQEKIRSLGLLNVETALLDLSSPSASVERQQSFDLIYSSMTLHHIRDTAGFLRRIATLLAPGGSIAIADLEREDGHFHDDPNEEVHHGFDRTELTAMMEAAGLQGISFNTIYTMNKKSSEGKTTAYPVFLCTATKG
ncbi:class I SAM-dependent methyltransferase [Chlorobium ferrooxidans]|nr:class I SAM-dependent methyltransferase [Chlorobium ferrooxidans]